MAENDVTIQINLDAKDAQAAIELFGKESARVLKNTESQSNKFFDAFKSGAFRLGGAVAGVVGGFAAIRQGINEAVEDAKLTRQIEAGLRAIGEESSAAVNGVLEFADAIKDATGVSDDLVKQTFIIAQTFGVSTERAKELTKAAIDLAAATGQDVETSVRLLGGTLDGTVGKLGNYGAEFRNLTKEQLEAGAAIDLVAQKFGGAASKDLETFSGRLGQLTNSFGDFLKEIGKIVTDSPEVQTALKNTADIINGVTNRIKEAKKESASRDFSVGASVLGVSGAYAEAAVNIRMAADEARAFADINIGGQSKAISEGFRGIVEQAQGATSATASLLDRFNQLSVTQAPKQLGLTGKALEDAKKKAQEAAKAFENLKAKLSLNVGDDEAKIKARYAQERLEIQTTAKEKFLTSKQTSELITILEKNQSDELYKYRLDQAKKESDEIRKQAEENKAFLQGVFANPFGNLSDRFQAEIVRGIEFVKTGKDLGSQLFKEGEIAASITGGLNLVLQGKAGATKAISGIADTIGASFGIPGLGAITELLSRGPEATKKFIKEFIDSVPDIIMAIAESIPVVVEALVDTLINKGGIVKIAIALVKAMTFAPSIAKLGAAILGVSEKQLTKGIEKGGKEAAANWTQTFKDFINNIGPAFGEFLLQLGPGLNQLADSLGRNLDQSFNRFDDEFNKQIKQFGDQFALVAREFVFGLGDAIGNFFSQLGPGFEAAISGFINAIGDALSVLFDPLLNGIQGLKPAFEALDTTFKGIGQIFVDFKNAIIGIFGSLRDGFNGLNNAIKSLIKPLEDLRSSFGGGKGGGKGLLAEGAQRLGSALGFANGGIVYAADGFMTPKGTDTVPAMLTPGELVVPRDMVSELGAFLMSQKSDAPGSDAAMLSAIYSAVTSPIVVKTEAKVNQQAFADIILQLNRQNARLSA